MNNKINKFELMQELFKFMENEKEKYPNLIKFMREQFDQMMSSK